MTTRILFFATLLLAASTGHASEMVGSSEKAGSTQTWPAVSSGELRYSMDVAGFRASDGATFQEVYLMVPGDQLTFKSNDDGDKVAGFSVDLCVLEAAGDTLHHQLLHRQTELSDSPGGAAASSVIDVIPVTLHPGAAEVSVVVADQHSGSKGQLSAPLSVRDLAQDGLILSDICLGTDLSRSTDTDRFVKNGYRISPNVMRRITEDAPKLHVYFETYNLAPASEGDRTTFSTYYSVQDTLGTEVMPLPGKRAVKPGANAVTVESLDLTGLPPGEYDLVVMVRDDLSRQSATARTRFCLIPTRPALGHLALDEEALARYYDGIKYLADESELREFNSRDPNGKRQFVIDFWQARDPSPGTPENEFALEHFKRMAQADQLFNEGRKKGSDTDRGRIFIVYGPPSDIERFHARSIGKDHTVWIYQTDGHYEFVFVDRRGNGRPELVHSTMPGELHNPGWSSDRWDEKYPTTPTGTPDVAEQ